MVIAILKWYLRWRTLEERAWWHASPQLVASGLSSLGNSHRHSFQAPCSLGGPPVNRATVPAENGFTESVLLIGGQQVLEQLMGQLSTCFQVCWSGLNQVKIRLVLPQGCQLAYVQLALMLSSGVANCEHHIKRMSRSC